MAYITYCFELTIATSFLSVAMRGRVKLRVVTPATCTFLRIFTEIAKKDFVQYSELNCVVIKPAEDSRKITSVPETMVISFVPPLLASAVGCE